MPQTLNTIVSARSLIKQIRGSQNAALQTSAFRTSNIPNLYPEPFNLLDPAIDEVWASQYYSGPNGSAPYADYFFSGQDIKVCIDGCDVDPNYADLPISSLTYRVEQKTMPLYGYNSYTYDALAKGSRQITGSFILVSRSPDYLLQAIALAASSRSQNHSSLPTAYSVPLSEDEGNLLKYWGTNQDSSLNPGHYNLFSQHPPFRFMIQYGVQSISVNQNTIDSTQLELIVAQQKQSATDINDRLVSPDPTLQQFMLVLLDGCQLVDMSTAYDSTGRPIGEMYEFIAHDVIYPPPSQATQSILA